VITTKVKHLSFRLVLSSVPCGSKGLVLSSRVSLLRLRTRSLVKVFATEQRKVTLSTCVIDDYYCADISV